MLGFASLRAHSDSLKPDPLTDWGSFGRLDGANSTRGPVAKVATGVDLGFRWALPRRVGEGAWLSLAGGFSG
jgi:hypothetical protein